MSLRWTEDEYKRYLKANDRINPGLFDQKTETKKIKKSKYSNEKTMVDGITFDSKKEARFYENLKILKMAGEIKNFTLQPEFIIQEGFIHKKTGKKIRPIKYIADFKIEWSNGKTEIVDVKSSKEFKTQVYRLKKKIFMNRFPNLDLVEVYDDMI